MGNLGKYQEIVEAAKAVGGVDNLIGRIEAGAVAKAAPRLLGKGAALGALGVTVVGTAGAVVKRAWENKKAREAVAEDAKAQLKVAVEESPASESNHPESIENVENVAEGGVKDSPPSADD